MILILLRIPYCNGLNETEEIDDRAVQKNASKKGKFGFHEADENL
jgi:hypothetical protein